MLGLSVRTARYGIALVAVTVLVIGAWTIRPHRLSHRPIPLPDSLVGVPRAPADRDFAANASWHDTVEPKIGGAELAGRSFQPGVRGQQPLTLNLSVARTDLSDRLDEHLARAPYLHVGDVTCSQTFDLSPSVSKGNGKVMPGWLACWRNSRDLSVVVLALDIPPDYLKTTAAAVDQAWELAR